MNHAWNELEWCDRCCYGRSEVEDNLAPRECPGPERDAAYYARKSRLRRSRKWADELVAKVNPLLRGER